MSFEVVPVKDRSELSKNYRNKKRSIDGSSDSNLHAFTLIASSAPAEPLDGDLKDTLLSQG